MSKRKRFIKKNIKASFSKRESGLSKREEIVCKENYKRKITIIETLGTNVEKPFPPNPSLSTFYNLLKNNGFNENIIRTDYKFESIEQAEYVLGSFFGKEMKEDIRKGKKNRIKEFTGIWIL